MGKVLLKNAIKRQKGKLYYIDGKGNVCESSMNRKGGKKGRKSCAAPKKKAAPKKRALKKSATQKKTTRRKTTKRK
jgi:hypothetical protein